MTHGRIRLFPEDLRRLFPKVQVGEPVYATYETAKLGRDERGQLVVVTFPDVYKQASPMALAQSLVRRAGYPWTTELARQTRACTGLPIVVSPSNPKE